MNETARPAVAPLPPVSQVYTWEPSNAAIAARYGLDPADILRFDTNTSPTSPAMIRAALAEPTEPSLNEYPDSWYGELTDAAAAYVGVRPEQVIVGAGADEVLDIVAKAFLAPGGGALIPVPTYAMYGVLTAQRGARLVAVPRLAADGRYALDVDSVRLRLDDVSVVWLCNPNNPTGLDEPADGLLAVLDAAADLAAPPLVVIDEAYHEFTGATAVPLLARYPNLLVIRTMSKAFALAGIRVGFGIAGRPIIERLERVRPPGSVSTVSAHLAARALAAPGYALDNVAAVADEREWLASRLAALGWAPSPSVANFLLVRIGDHESAEAAAEGLLRAGIVPRTFGPANPLRGHLRLTVRTREQNERLLEVVRAVRR